MNHIENVGADCLLKFGIQPRSVSKGRRDSKYIRVDKAEVRLLHQPGK